MMKPIEALTRLFSRGSASAVVSEIYSKAINQPLFIHPAIGEMIVQGYLHSDVSQLRGDAGRRGENQSEATVGVLDISGALVARETPGVCGSGPLSYEEIRRDFDMMMADKSIQTIIGRFDTPGGLAAQNMDLADHIYASRGQGKRLIAMVDDMAYSAGFALASAFDEIWITRTGGVGSVGVVSYHVDQSEFNNKIGVRVEYLYAGARKIDGNPHEGLSDEARERFISEIGRLYNLFAATTARNLGFSVDDVKKTEAGTFHGEEAVKAGFAHKVGTFSELLQSLIPQGEKNLTVVTMEDQSGVSDPGMNAVDEPLATDDIQGDQVDADPGESSDDAGSDDSADAEKQVAEQAEQKHREYISEIKALCAAAKRPDAAEHFIQAGTPVESVRSTLFEILATGAEINSSEPVRLVENKQQQAAAGWAKAFAQVKKLNHLNSGDKA